MVKDRIYNNEFHNSFMTGDCYRVMLSCLMRLNHNSPLMKARHDRAQPAAGVSDATSLVSKVLKIPIVNGTIGYSYVGATVL